MESARRVKKVLVLLSGEFNLSPQELLDGLTDAQSIVWSTVIERAGGESEKTPDGPIQPFGFRWRGEEFEGLPPLPWRLINHLWQQEERSASFDELGKPVWDDQEAPFEPDFSGNRFGPVRRDANKWLKENNLPFKVTSKGRKASFKKI